MSDKEEKQKNISADNIVTRDIVEEMNESYLDYAMSVIVSRALPDIRDGLKPVHRRILYAMHKLGLGPGAKRYKSAAVVGEVMAKYHPHGDMAIYDALVRMAQDFSLRYPLISGQGNWGCFTKDTKVKLTDGRNLDFVQLIRESKEGKKNYTYTINLNTKEIEVAEIKNPRLTKKKAQLMNVILDNKEEIHCTPNHLFMLRSGSYKEAQYLKPGDSLMPLYTRFSTKEDDANAIGYEMLHQPLKDNWGWTHRLAKERTNNWIPKIDKALIYFNNFQEIVDKAENYNHKVISVKTLSGKEDVYDLTIENTHNFALAAGIFVHNSIDGDSAAAMRYCVTSDTLIPTEKGLVPIGKITPKNSENIKINILSKDRNVNRATKWFDSGEHSTIKITTSRGFSIQGTHNHPLLMWTKNIITGQPEFRWKLLSQIQENDIAVIDRTPDLLWPTKNVHLKRYYPSSYNRRWQIKILPRELNEDLTHILGAFIAEGTIKQNKIEFCNSDTDWIDEFKKRWAKVFPDCRLHEFNRKPNSFGKKNYKILEIHSRHIIEFLRNIGLQPVKSEQKKLPELILQSPKPVIKEFLKAYFEGDGSVSYSSKMNELCCISKSELLVRQLQILLLRFGIASAKRFDTYRDIHKLYIRGLTNYILFQNEIGFWGKEKNKKLKEVVKRTHKDYSQTDFVPFIQNFARTSLKDNFYQREFAVKHNFDRYPNLERNYEKIAVAVKLPLQTDIKYLFEFLLAKNYLFDTVSKIENGGIQRVYSLKVASDCHSFVGNGFINHNTECRMSTISSEMLRDIEKETVNFAPNYDGLHKEPKVLPSAIPQLLLNGTLGIAVGMATNIPPHNIKEVISGIKYMIQEPQCTVKDLMKFIQGPDFPTGGLIFNIQDISYAYTNGRGGIVSRGEAEITESKKGHYQIIINSIPYQVNKAELISKIAELVNNKKIEGIRDVRDESDKEGLQIAIDLKSDAFPQKILNSLYKQTDLEKTYHFNMVALIDGIQPQTLSLRDIIEHFIKHRREIIERRSRFDLRKAEERAHILEGLKKALDHIDAVIKTIKTSNSKEEAHKRLMSGFKLSSVQAQAILEMKLQALAKLERQKIEDELKEKQKLIRDLKALLKDPQKRDEVVIKELDEIESKYGDERKTKIVKEASRIISKEDLVPEQEAALMLTRGGYIKRVNPEEYRAQRRGGRGVVGITTKEEDIVDIFLSAGTHDDLLFFSDQGKVYKTKMYEIPEGKRITKGKSIMNFLSLAPEEKITSVLSMPQSAERKELFLAMITKDGIIKKIESSRFQDVRKSGIIAIKLQKEDWLRWTRVLEKNDHIILSTAKGKAIRFKESDIRPMGRNAAGIRAIKLKKGDGLIGADVISSKEKGAFLLVMSEKGFGKKTNIKNYRLQRRGGSGVKTANITAKTGPLISAKIIDPSLEEIIAVSQKGHVIRTALSGIPELGRMTQGVRIMKLDSDDSVASIVCL